MMHEPTAESLCWKMLRCFESILSIDLQKTKWLSGFQIFWAQSAENGISSWEEFNLDKSENVCIHAADGRHVMLLS